MARSEKKRRGHGEGTIYHVPARPGRAEHWVGAIDLGWQVGKDGKPHRTRKTVKRATQREVITQLRKLRAEMDAGVHTDAATVETWARHWLDEIAAAKVRPRTLDGYRTYVETWIVPYLGKRRMTDLRPDHIRAMLTAMRTQGKSEATRHHAYAVLRALLTVAQKEGRIARNAAQDMQSPPALGKGKHGELTLDQARRILVILADNDDPWPDADRWGVALLCGLRQSEALGLDWSDVHLEEKVLLVRQSAQQIKGMGMQIGETKSKTSVREVPLIPAVVQLLERTPPEARTGWLWPGRDPSRPRSSSYDYRLWQRLLAAAGVDPVPLHGARATTATLLTQAGVPDVVVSMILGHAQVQVTHRYIRSQDPMRREAMGALDALISGTIPTPDGPDEQPQGDQ